VDWRLFSSRIARTLLQEDIEFCTVLIACSPQQIGLAAQRHEHFVEVPGRTWLATRSLDAMCEARTDLVAPAPNRLVASDHAALEQQLFNVAQAQLKPKMTVYCVADNRSRKMMTVIKGFCVLHSTILCDRSSNVTMLFDGIVAWTQTRQTDDFIEAIKGLS
jgi:hypothetical protein